MEMRGNIYVIFKPGNWIEFQEQTLCLEQGFSAGTMDICGQMVLWKIPYTLQNA